MTISIDVLEEPRLEFGLSQKATNPKSGLYFFGPPETKGRPKHIRIGVVGTPFGLELYSRWSRAMNRHLPPLVDDSLNHAPFPGFASLLGADVGHEPDLQAQISAAQLARAIRMGRRHEAIKASVSLFEEAIREKLEENFVPDVWFVVIPDEVYKYGRPKSVVPRNEAVRSTLTISRHRATQILGGERSLFESENNEAETFLFEPNFHHQLKARLLDRREAVLQIVRESTLEMLLQGEAIKRRLQDPASIAWNLSTTLFFKAGGLPWKLASVRPRVCYVGLVFKLFPDTVNDTQKACCGAQMFLDSGDGLVFRGTPGQYYNPKTKQFHLSESEAKDLIAQVVLAYKKNDPDDLPPTELVIHGRTRFNKAECRGFAAGAPDTLITTVRISETNELKLYAPRDTPVLRGTAMYLDDWRGYLWTKGFVPELGTYPGREVPKPLAVEIVEGNTDLRTVMSDLLMLTKLNFNSCVYADGSPVTLRFADAVGEIITAVPERFSMTSGPPMPFKHYI